MVKPVRFPGTLERGRTAARPRGCPVQPQDPYRAVLECGLVANLARPGATDRIARLDEDDRCGPALPLQRQRGRRAVCHGYVRRGVDQFLGIGPNAIGVASAPARIDADTDPLLPAQLVERLPKGASGSFSEVPTSIATRRTRPGCCARAVSGHAAAAPPSSVMNSRRSTRSPRRRARPRPDARLSQVCAFRPRCRFRAHNSDPLLTLRGWGGSGMSAPPAGS